ncbi:hypothetical protein FDW96_11850 [Citrobacter sp. TBCS-15]|uniref:hypothetical protein n=6 Tax=Bacteria TaxID=2 RepID=UPI00068A28DA|nr:hypothetical protein [Porphyromonas macacae]TKU05543.1 hypothetical protein FDW96_11850 [Citrobacter sp. TBCS-15]
MTIKNFTFFSPSGTEFPVGSNNDGKLYMMLTGMDYGTIRRKDWSNPINTALNVQYTNTSIIAGGRYFELSNETVALKGNSVNYIHANIDLTQTAHPVTLSAETSNNSNNVDLNNSSGVLKVLIDIRTTDGTGVVSSEKPRNVTTLDQVNAENINVKLLSVDGDVSDWTALNMSNVTTAKLQYKKKNGIVTVTGGGNFGNFRANQTKQVAFLPENVRPVGDISVTLSSLNGNNNNKPMELQITANGEIRVWSHYAGNNQYAGGTATYLQ